MTANSVKVIKQISCPLTNSRNYKQVQLEQISIIILALTEKETKKPTNVGKIALGRQARQYNSGAVA